MMSPDLINGGFEAFASVMVLNHCRVLAAEKIVRGVSVVSVTFFMLWGVWNLYYYPGLEQTWSFYGGVLVVLANLFHVSLLLLYRRQERLGTGVWAEQTRRQYERS